MGLFLLKKGPGESGRKEGVKLGGNIAFYAPVNSSTYTLLFLLYIINFYLPATTVYGLGPSSKSAQWAAVSTHSGAISAPPQI